MAVLSPMGCWNVVCQGVGFAGWVRNAQHLCRGCGVCSPSRSWAEWHGRCLAGVTMFRELPGGALAANVCRYLRAMIY
jgi:hypothetical protein